MQRFLVAVVAIWLWGCAGGEYRKMSGFAQGTTYSIVYDWDTDLQASVEELLNEFENSLSIYRDSSLISNINENRSDSIDGWFGECFGLASLINKQSGGLFEPTLRPLIAAYGFGGKDAVELTESQIDSVRGFVGFDKLSIVDGRLVKVDSRVEVDFNAIAKGYSVDVVSRMFDSLGVSNYMVEIGGEIFAFGVNPKGVAWRIGVDVPYDGNIVPGADVQTIVELSGRGMATSGNYRNFRTDASGNKVVHTIDPRTMSPSIHNLLSATILAPSTALADGYATACMVGGLEWAKGFVSSLDSVDCYLIYSNPDGTYATYSTIK